MTISKRQLKLLWYDSDDGKSRTAENHFSSRDPEEVARTMAMSIDSDPRQPSHEGPAAELKRKLLTGAIDGDIFLEKVMEIDQSTPRRTGAPKNVELLLDPDVVTFFTTRPEYDRWYQDTLSLSYFHKAQLEADTEEGYPEALANFKKALELPGETEWIHYVAGTVAAFEGDLSTLTEHFEALPDTALIDGVEVEHVNKNILYNFKKQFERGEGFNYLKGYNNQRLP